MKEEERLPRRMELHGRMEPSGACMEPRTHQVDPRQVVAKRELGHRPLLRDESVQRQCLEPRMPLVEQGQVAREPRSESQRVQNQLTFSVGVLQSKKW